MYCIHGFALANFRRNGAGGGWRGVLMLEGAIGLAAAAGVRVALLGGVALEMTPRREDIGSLERELTQVRRTLDQADIELVLAKDGMMAVHQAFAEGGGAKR